jgi:hypothetical protein
MKTSQAAFAPVGASASQAEKMTCYKFFLFILPEIKLKHGKIYFRKKNRDDADF